MPDKTEFAGRVVVVTGGAQGIGLAVTQAFAEAGARVIAVDVDETAGHEAAARLARVSYFRADVAEETDVAALADHLQRTFARVDVLVNNAGIGHTRPLRDRAMKEWDRVLAVNLRGPYMMTKYLADLLCAADPGPGAVINIASTRALMSEPHTEPYSASKGGVLALTHSLAVSLGPFVRVNAISPGWIETSEWQRKDRRATPRHRPEDLAQHPVGRVGAPPDIAAACLFLASPAAGFITGTNLVVDGGMTVKMIYAE